MRSEVQHHPVLGIVEHYPNWNRYELWVLTDMPPTNAQFMCIFRPSNTLQYYVTHPGQPMLQASVASTLGPFDTIEQAYATALLTHP